MAVRAIVVVNKATHGQDTISDRFTAHMDVSVIGDDIGTLYYTTVENFEVGDLDPNSSTLSDEIADAVKTYLVSMDVPFDELDTVRILTPIV